MKSCVHMWNWNLNWLPSRFEIRLHLYVCVIPCSSNIDGREAMTMNEERVWLWLKYGVLWWWFEIVVMLEWRDKGCRQFFHNTQLSYMCVNYNISPPLNIISINLKGTDTYFSFHLVCLNAKTSNEAPPFFN